MVEEILLCSARNLDPDEDDEIRTTKSHRTVTPPHHETMAKKLVLKTCFLFHGMASLPCRLMCHDNSEFLCLTPCMQ
ncbi:hypothetical protein RRG08_000393 [Elysia crispata]|uniref:Uncharacterized protein n=1 Tax=Elysia crispata TaxID=231223 RepID=A0AAE1DLX4_9GAST|nr:hypothetical protein RRG08_000393 [Elysia crispata]